MARPRRNLRRIRQLVLAGWLLHVPTDHAILAAGALSLAGGVLATRRDPRLVRRDVPIPDLPRALDGYRIAQLSDVHCGSYTPEARVAAWVARVNQLEV